MKNELTTQKHAVPATIHDLFNLVENPGDELNLRVTNNYRKVAKLKRGNQKDSITRYPNGSMVMTRSRRVEK